jgi:double-stranded uracil-DNA glycosylase
MSNYLADLLTGFDCVADEFSEILVLGSMPGVASLQQQEYYAHPRNAFWKIMQTLYDIPVEADYNLRLELLKANKIALWDVAHQCVRSGSLDSNIKADSVQVNDFKALFEFSPNIKNVYFNGGKSAELYKRRVLKEADIASLAVKYTQLPSTSPANARLSLEQKVAAWQQIRA